MKLSIYEHTVNILMYHYVRPIKNSAYPNLKGLELKIFKNQINFFCRNYNVISAMDLKEIITKNRIPKKPSFLLTFDDGYADHYKNVFPYLLKKKVSGCFYMPTEIIEKKKILDVNKIHCILEKEQDSKKILKEINYILIKYFSKNLDSYDLTKINLGSRYDNKNTVLVKKLLQFFLPEKERILIVNKLFHKIVNVEIKQFYQEFYMNKENIKDMYKNNMHFGSHGTSHTRLALLNKVEQEYEIKKSLSFFAKNGLNVKDLSICYPYGSYNLDSLKLSKKYKFMFGLSTEVGSVNIDKLKNYLSLPRFNANDFL